MDNDSQHASKSMMDDLIKNPWLDLKRAGFGRKTRNLTENKNRRRLGCYKKHFTVILAKLGVGRH